MMMMMMMIILNPALTSSLQSQCWYNWRADRPVHGRTPAASGCRCTVDGRETTTEELVVFQINFYSNSVSVN